MYESRTALISFGFLSAKDSLKISILELLNTSLEIIYMNVLIRWQHPLVTVWQRNIALIK